MKLNQCLALSYFILFPASGLFASARSEAYKAYNKQEFAEAAEKFQRHVQKHPEDWDQTYNVGVSLYQAGKLEEAQAYFERAKQSPELKMKTKAAYNSALVDIMRKNYKRAEQSLQEALSYDNDSSMIRENLEWVRQQNPEDQNKQQKDEAKSEDKQDDAEKKDGEQQDQQQDGQKQDQQDGQKQDQQDGQKQDQQQGEQKQDQQQDGQKQDQQQNGQKQDGQKQDQQQAGQEQNSQQQDGQKQDKEGQQQAGQKQDSKQQDGQQAAKDDKSKQPGDPQQAQSGEGKQEDGKQEDGKQQAVAEDPNKDPGKKPQGSASTPAQASGQGRVLSEKDLEVQQAEKLLRSIEDKIGRYPLDAASGQGGQNDKEW